MIFISFIVVSFILSLVLTKFLQAYALSRNIIDVPNERSSHSVPTPRGGGMSIVITFSLSLIMCAMLGLISWEVSISVFFAGLITAVIGFLDDHGHVNAGLRLICHFVSAILIVYAANGLPVLSFFGYSMDFSTFGWLLATISVVWILNLFNFMDGIDGIAGVEAITSTLIIGAICYFLFDAPNVALLHFILGFSSLGFLILNFPPAKIFMGDAGSGFMGLMLAMLLLVSSHISESLFWCWLIMLGVFIVDATFTLIRRMINGFKLHAAHRSHAYQFASRKYGGHMRVTLGVLVINLFWLAPICIFIAIGKISGFSGFLIAYLPLLFLAVKYQSGKVESANE